MKYLLLWLMTVLAVFTAAAEVPAVVAAEGCASFYSSEDDEHYTLDRCYSIKVPESFSRQQTYGLVTAISPEMSISAATLEDVSDFPDFRPVTEEMAVWLESEMDSAVPVMNRYFMSCEVEPVEIRSQKVIFSVSYFEFMGGLHPLENTLELTYNIDTLQIEN